MNIHLLDNFFFENTSNIIQNRLRYQYLCTKKLHKSLYNYIINTVF